MTISKERVERSFSRAASTYEEFTFFQKQSVNDFAAFLRSRVAAFPEKILEAGCGTGLLTSQLRTLFPSASIYSTDLSSGMISFCLSRFAGERNLSFRQHDFDCPYEVSGFDLAVSSLSLQWSSGLRTAFANLAASLKPGGELFLSLPLSSSLEQVREKFRRENVVFRGLTLPEKESVEKMLHFDFERVECSVCSYGETYPSFHALLKAMRLNGTSGGNAGTPAAVLKKLIRESREETFSVTYDVGMFRGVKKI